MDIREEEMGPHMMKFHVGGMPFPAVFHRFTAPDLGDPHDHPWSFRSIILHGGYVEEVFALDGTSERIHRRVGDSFVVPAEHIHRLIDLPAGECWTFIMPLPSPARTSGMYQFRDGVAYFKYWHEFEFHRLPL